MTIPPGNMRYRTVFLDRDGVINRMRGDYVKRWEEFELLPNALGALRRLKRSGRTVIVLTNQSVIGQGIVGHEVVDDIHQRMTAVVEDHGGHIAAVLVCPHARGDRCICRKPAPGLFFRARDELGVDLADAIMVGDQMPDVQAARAAGCDAILLDPDGAMASQPEAAGCTVVANIAEAADVICDD